MTTVTTAATYKTQITGDLPDWGLKDVDFQLVASFFNGAGEEVLAGKTYTMTLDASGNDDGSFYLPTPDNTGDAGVNWRLTLPSGYLTTVTVAYSASAQSVRDLIAAGSTTTDPDTITAALASKASLVSGATADNLASLTAAGDLADSGYGVLDEDDMASDSDTAVPTQQSVKAYVDANAGGASDVGDLTTTGLTPTNYLRVADPSGLEERTPAQILSDIGAETAGAAAAVQSNLTTHTGNTSNPHSTTAAQVGAYATGDFSAAPTAAEPLKADGSGKLRVEGLGIGGAPGSSHRLNIVGNSSSITVGVSLTDQRVGYARQWIMKAADGDYSWIDVTASNAIRIYIKGNTGLVGIGEANPQAQLHAKTTDAVTNAVTNIQVLAHNSSGTPAAGFGGGVSFTLKSSTTNDSAAARIVASWSDATHATRQADLILYASDSAGEREGLRIRANGTEAAIGFYGVTPTARQLLATGAGASVDDVITALQTLGLVKQS